MWASKSGVAFAPPELQKVAAAVPFSLDELKKKFKKKKKKMIL
jgi:hypothetical protein